MEKHWFMASVLSPIQLSGDNFFCVFLFYFLLFQLQQQATSTYSIELHVVRLGKYILFLYGFDILFCWFYTFDGLKLSNFKSFLLFLKIFVARHLHLAGGGARLCGEELRPLRVQGAARRHQVEHPRYSYLAISTFSSLLRIRCLFGPGSGIRNTFFPDPGS